MENDLMDSLTDLSLEDSLEADDTDVAKILDEGARSFRFTKLVSVLAQQIKALCNLEETVHKMDDTNEFTSFLLELSSFLKELGCPYQKLVTGHLSSRLQSKEDCMLLLDYLVSELMAARMIYADRFKEKPKMEIVVKESTTAKDLKDILIRLKFNKPPPNITAEMLFSKLEAKLKDTISKEGEQLVGKPLYNKAISDKEWSQLEAVFLEMYEDYQLRKETLITRLECTIQSFEWSDKNKDKESIQAAYRARRDTLKTKPDVKLSDFLSARTSLLQIEKTSSSKLRTAKSEVYKVIMGKVPDRGGRPHEQQPPPPEMPSWQQRSQVGGRGGGSGVFNRGGGGGGGFNRGGADNHRGGHQDARGGYNNFRGNQDGNRQSYGNHDGNRQSYGNHDGGRASFDNGRGNQDQSRPNYGNQEGIRGGYRGGRVQGGYTQGCGDRPQTSPGNFNQKRNYQTYEVPSGGYTQGSSNDYQNNSAYPGQGYNSARGYERTGSQDGQWSSGNYGNSHGNNHGYQNRGGYQNEHDDRDRRGRGGYARGGRR